MHIQILHIKKSYNIIKEKLSTLKQFTYKSSLLNLRIILKKAQFCTHKGEKFYFCYLKEKLRTGTDEKQLKNN